MRKALLWLLVSFCLGLAAQDRELEELLQQARNLRSAGKLEESTASYGRVLERDPRNVKAYLGRAHTRRAQKDFAGARADLESAQKLEPGAARVLYGFGLLHSDLKEYDTAVQFFERDPARYHRAGLPLRNLFGGTTRSTGCATCPGKISAVPSWTTTARCVTA